ncbi:hypothetical protein L6R50_11875 [Myxococcota bacterium]|nr:hypothetical protein [Myxococcota bacterium]
MPSKLRPLLSAALALPAATLVVGGCTLTESGIAERHIQGIATLPPHSAVEAEVAGGLSNEDADNAEDLGVVAYHTLLVDGGLDTIDFSLNEYRGDHDTFKLAAGVPGRWVIELRWDDSSGSTRYGMWVSDAVGTSLSDPSNNFGTGLEYPTYEIELGEEEEFFVQVSGRSAPETAVAPFPYRLVLTHVEAADDEDDYATSSLNFRSDPILVGAFLGEEPGRLGDPVSGTSTGSWQYDDESFTWWAPFEMWTVQQVTSASDVIIVLDDGTSRDDGIDNNCDGIVDGGNIRPNEHRFDDVDGDGATEVDGDCDDNDPTVRPGFSDDFGDSIDNDCSGLADDGPDGLDRDGDGYSVFAGDCNDADPNIWPSLDGETDICDGIDNDCSGQTDASGPQYEGEPCIEGNQGTNTRATQDLDGDGYTPADGDCNDADAGIHPDPAGEGEEAGGPAPYFDWQDFVDNDCDGEVDENYDMLDGDGTPNPDFHTDLDGDGYSKIQGDCDDTRDVVAPGLYETRTEYQVNALVDRVYVYAGSFNDLNNTNLAPGDLASSEVTPVDLDDTTATWTMDQDWDLGTGGRLMPSGLLTVEVDTFVPISYCNRVEEDPALDAENDSPNYSAVPYPGAIDLGTTCEPGTVTRGDGEILTIVPDSWNGDTDTWSFVVGVDGYVNVDLDWPTAGADYDFLFYCYYGDEFNPYNYYLLIDSAVTATDNAATPQHEGGPTIIPLTAGTECWIWVAGYLGDVGPYSLKVYQ